MGFEPAHYFLQFSGRPVRHLNRVVERLMGAMISVWGQCRDRFDVAAQFIDDGDPWFAKLGNQSLKKPLRSFGIPARLYPNIKDVSPRVDRAPQPVLLATDRDHDLIHMHLSFGRGRSRRMQTAKWRLKRLTHRRTVSRLRITARAANRSSTSAVLSVHRRYAQTA